ncbi:MAG: magnesium chelatase subunit H, partial [Pseudomonadota bacterium]
FGYEGDPMRLLFEKGFSPTHAFSAFYRYLREDFGADAVLHFGTHGALEFMPGKQAGMSEQCWPDRLIGDIPNVYAYAVNNPSEGTIAKRRSAATLVSYLTPPVSHAGLYRGLIDLKTSLERWRALEPNDRAERDRLAPVLQAQASELNLTDAVPAWDDGDQTDAQVLQLIDAVHELEYELIPHGLHVLGEAPDREETAELLLAVAEARGMRPDARSIEMLLDGAKTDKAAQHSGLDPSEDSDALFSSLAETAALLQENGELSALIHALDGGFTRPAPAGDLLRNPEILPTGRNIHGFDPFRIPSAFAISDGKQQADRLLAKHMSSGFGLPRSIALVLWGTDNLKSEGGPIAQALALMGAQPRFDSYGRLCGAELISLEELGRPRIDVVMTLSGIFRDLLPLQSKLLAEAAYLAASADEPLDQNFIRQSALEYQHVHGCDLETAALRVFSNAEGAYGSNVNQLVDSGRWNDEEEIAEVYTRRKCFAYGRDGAPQAKRDLLQSILSNVDLAYQNLESVELGVTTVDHYFDTLDGISRAATKARGEAMPVYVGDQTRGPGKVRTLSEQVALETRTRVLNPKWYEGMLKHGYEGVRQIESHVTNTMGWSATTGQVAPWVYEDLSDAFVLDDAMRERLASLNPIASAKVANRLLEAHERNYWKPDEATLEALRKAGEELEDRIEGVGLEEVAA